MFLFTYGTLRPSLSPDRARAFKLSPRGRAVIPGGFALLNLGPFPALVPDTGSDTAIVGELVEVDDLARLDDYEGYRPGGDGLYDRQEVNVLGHDTGIVKAWVYFMQPAGRARFRKAPVVESGDWATVLEAR
jgi:gamma-glutamylcyclotransferase (GGCT)/AIG2-like uncharacterized protein YtfP